MAMGAFVVGWHAAQDGKAIGQYYETVTNVGRRGITAGRCPGVMEGE
jgi:hypothetical protein